MNKKFGDAIQIMIEQYHRYKELFEEADKAKDHVMLLCWMNMRNAIFDTLVIMADYDMDQVVEWIG